MSKYQIKTLWEERYGNAVEVYDYSGRLMKKGAISQPNSSYHPTIEHIRPLAKGGKDYKGNIIISHTDSNKEKGDNWNHWKSNNKRFKAVKVIGDRSAYEVREI